MQLPRNRKALGVAPLSKFMGWPFWLLCIVWQLLQLPVTFASEDEAQSKEPRAKSKELKTKSIKRLRVRSPFRPTVTPFGFFTLPLHLPMLASLPRPQPLTLCPLSLQTTPQILKQ
jgi:hypothetical protein